MVEDDPIRFGAEFGPKRTENSTGVSLSTFKNLVWISNLGGLLLCAIGLELIMVQQQFYLGVAAIIAGVVVALFPSNYEIVGMEAIQDTEGNSEKSEPNDNVKDSIEQEIVWPEIG